jgi:hypothetical protein
LTVFLEGPFGPQDLRVAFHELVLRFTEFFRARLAMQFIQQGFGIKRLQVGRTAGHEQENHRLCSRRLMRLLGRQRIFQPPRRSAQRLLEGHVGEGQRTESSHGVSEEFSAIAGPANVFRHNGFR